MPWLDNKAFRVTLQFCLMKISEKYRVTDRDQRNSLFEHEHVQHEMDIKTSSTVLTFGLSLSRLQPSQYINIIFMLAHKHQVRFIPLLQHQCNQNETSI